MKRVFTMLGVLLVLTLGMGYDTKPGDSGGGCATMAEKQQGGATKPAMPSGVGLLLTDTNGFIEVAGVVEGFPADQAGIRPRDEILQIEALDAKGMSVQVATGLIRGAQGSTVALVVKSSNGISKTVTLERRQIPSGARFRSYPESPIVPAVVPPTTAVPEM